MKQIFIILLALCLLSTALYGCGKKENSGGNSSNPISSAAVSQAVATPAPVQMAKAVKVNADGGLNIRSEPSTDGEILGLADDGSKLPLLVEKATNGWYQIEYHGGSAYVSAEYAEVEEVTLEEYNRLKAEGNSLETSSSASSQADDDPGRAPATSTPKPAGTSSAASSAQPAGNEDGE